MSGEVQSSDYNNIHEEVFRFNDWIITTKKSHILQSKCVSPFICDKTKQKAIESGDAIDLDRICMFCRYEEELSMAHMPDMTYSNNWLIVQHNNGFALKWNCLDALKLVPKELPQHIKVSASEDWLKARSDCEFSKITKKPFDWTFTTDYKGTVVPNSDGMTFECQSTQQRIDIEKLKTKEEILFYDDIHLFEDELADHGVAQCSVKIRVMKNSFYILMRFFLRIDNVLVRLYDTRLFHEVGTNYILREFSTKEKYIKDLDLPPAILTNPVELSTRLDPSQEVFHKLVFKAN